MTESANAPRILIYDLEVTPTLGWVYGHYDTNVMKVEREPYVMCFGYKWLGEKTTKIISQVDFPEHYAENPYDDSLVVRELWKLLDEAQIVIAHNAQKFDNRVANERFLVHRLGPPSPYKTIDTLQVAKRYFRNGSNSLNNLCMKLDLGSKTAATHADLWHKCVNGCEASWKKMNRYCKKDVDILEKLYLTVRPYIANHPNVAHLSGQLSGCPKCGSQKIQYRGLQKSNQATYRRVHCQDCGAWSRERLQDEVEKANKPDFVNISPSL